MELGSQPLGQDLTAWALPASKVTRRPMNHGSRSLGLLILVAAAVWHGLAVLSPAWMSATKENRARDFASYYYAVQVAAEGGDPYHTPSLGSAARNDRSRSSVHPYLYAPPFLLTMTWALPLDLRSAYHVWFWLHELAALLTGLVIWRWWRPLGNDTWLWFVGLLAVMTAVPNNHAMGQANFPGLALALAGLWQTDRGRPTLGGICMGVACMLKMSPALWVVWWLARQQWRAAFTAVATGIALSILTLPLASLSVQWRFYTEVLPTFGSGDYNGLSVPIGLFGNHSLPNLINQGFPGEDGVLSVTGRAISTVFALGSLGVLSTLFSDPASSGFARAAQAACIGVLILLVPVYTYEHHLVFALPAAAIAAVGWWRGKLALAWGPPIVLAVVLLLFDLQAIRALARGVSRAGTLTFFLFQEAKFMSLLVLLAATATLGGTSSEQRNDDDAPTG